MPFHRSHICVASKGHGHVRSDVVTLDSGSAAGVPSTGQVQVVCALSSDVLLTDMVLDES